MDLGHAYALQGEVGRAEGVIEALHERAAHHGYSVEVAVGTILGNLGRADEAFERLEKGFLEHDPILLFLRAFYWFDELRSDSRYEDLCRRVGLP